MSADTNFSSGHDHKLELAVNALRAGEVVAIPTETVYGLAADASNPLAVEKIFRLKNRPLDHPLILHCYDLANAIQYSTELADSALALAERFWPGPLTLVVPKSARVSLQITGGQETVAIRVPNHPLATELLRRFGRAVAAPSANRYGKVSPTTAEHVRAEFGNEALMVLDGGPCEIGIESTIVDCSQPDRIAILRPGFVTAEQIFACLGRVPELPSQNSPRVAGSLASHYAPQAQVVLVEQGFLDSFLQNSLIEGWRTLYCLRSRPAKLLNLNSGFVEISKDSADLARQLYSLLRQADEQGFERIVFEMPTQIGVGTAVADRLRRAATRE